jgi:transketolase
MASALDLRCINTLRFLSDGTVQQAGSGHPSLPLGAATMAYALCSGQLKHHPAKLL